MFVNVRSNRYIAVPQGLSEKFLKRGIGKELLRKPDVRGN